MNSRNSICQQAKNSHVDLLLDPESVSAAVRQHLAECDNCRAELQSLESTMAVLDGWQAPEPTPWFDSRMAARLREERQSVPAGFVERMRARLLFGTNMQLRPLAAGALALLLMIGGGTYIGMQSTQHPAPAPSATIRDLQSLDENAQVFQQLNDLDNGESGGGSSNSPAGNNL